MRKAIDVTQTLPKTNTTVDDVRSERDACHMPIINFSNSNSVDIYWDLNEKAIADGMCKIKVGDKEAIVHAEQVKRALRWV